MEDLLSVLTQSKQQNPQRIAGQHRKDRMRLTTIQLKCLNKIFENKMYPSKDEFNLISQRLNLEVKSLRIWFQNRRAKHKNDNNLTRKKNAANQTNLETKKRNMIEKDEKKKAIEIIRVNLNEEMFDSDIIKERYNELEDFLSKHQP
ncbi:hypothetical protein NUSPORA_01567 [Nucleospora cyclopteri]